MIDMDVKFDTKKLERHLTTLEKRAIPAALTSALNRTATSVLAKGASRLKQVTGTDMRVKDIKEQATIKKANFRRLNATIRVSGGAINIGRFNATQGKKGVSARPWGGRKRVFPGTFFIGDDRRDVYVRQGPERGPLRQVYGPSLAREFADPEMVRFLKAHAGKTLRKNFFRDMRFRIRRLT